MSFSMTIAKRGFHLGIVYVGMSVLLLVFGSLLSAVTSLIPAGATVSQGVDLGGYLSLIGVPLMSLAGLLASTPVSLLFVHDKENGTLEYLLSMGFDQRDIFRAYLEASFVLGAPLVVVGGAAAALVNLLLGPGASLAATALAITLALGLSAIALVAVLMSAFTALQRQPMGMNQPLGIAIGAFVIMGAMVVPLAVPTFQIVLELVISGIVGVVALVLLAMTPRLIRREKMLP